MTRISKETTPAIDTMAEVEAAVEAVAITTHVRAELAAKMEQDLAAVRAGYADELDTLDMQIAFNVDNLHAWAKRNRATEFAARQSIELTHGTLGFRVGQPSLSLVKGKTWENVLANLSLLHLGKYIRQILETNREALLSDADILGKQLEAIGCRVRQVERFFVEPLSDERKGAAA